MGNAGRCSTTIVADAWHDSRRSRTWCRSRGRVGVARITMGTTLHTLKGRTKAPRATSKRIGRGRLGHCARQRARAKGQKARTGHHGARLGFEGGQMPMQRRFPKKGFTNPLPQGDLRGQPRRRSSDRFARGDGRRRRRSGRGPGPALGDAREDPGRGRAHQEASTVKAHCVLERRPRRRSRRRAARAEVGSSPRGKPQPPQSRSAMASGFAEHRQDPRAAQADPVHARAARGLSHRRLRHDAGREPRRHGARS